MPTPGTESFYRIVKSNPPTTDDFLSYKALGIPLIDPRNADVYDGVSIWDTDMEAYRRALKKPKPRFVAILEVPTDGSFRVQRTLRSEGHYTIWGTPDDLLKLVSRVVEV